MRYVVDTGALLSLACSSYFSFLFEEYEITTTKEVYQELLEFAQYNDFLGQQAQKILKIIREKRLITEQSKEMLSLKINAAELSIFSLGKEKKYMIITDDMHAARVAEQELHLSSRPSFYLFLLLYKKKRITKQQLMEDLETITKQRNWMTGVLYTYVKDIIESQK